MAAPDAVDGGFDLGLEQPDQFFVGVDESLLFFNLGEDGKELLSTENTEGTEKREGGSIE